MIHSKIKTKYCEISFNEDHNGDDPFYWASVGMAWADKDGPVAKAFAILMDERLKEEARAALKDAVELVHRDIYLEDADLLVNLRRDKKHLAAKLLGIVESVEKQFDDMIEDGRHLESVYVPKREVIKL